MDQSLIFGGINSSNYGIYISGEGVFNAPKRDVTSISIPGRNGVFLLDNNRFENIVVTYPAHCTASDINALRTQLSNYRNALAQQVGYRRLEDTINSDEYRMAAFIDGFDAEPIGQSTSATFELKFNCKPQRFLKTGENTYTMSSGGGITNQGAFTAYPLIMVKGYGNITIRDGGNKETTMTVANATLGRVQLGESVGGSDSATSIAYATGLVNTGDPITMDAGTAVQANFRVNGGYEWSATSSSTTGTMDYNVTTDGSSKILKIYVTFPSIDFVAGTDKTVTHITNVFFKYAGSSSPTSAGSITTTVAYRSSNKNFKTTMVLSVNATNTYQNVSQKAAYGTSSISTLGNPTYIDCDLGEAYKYVDGEAVSLNNSVSLGSEIPALSRGTNTITYDSTITEFKIIPRWWKI